MRGTKIRTLAPRAVTVQGIDVTLRATVEQVAHGYQVWVEGKAGPADETVYEEIHTIGNDAAQDLTQLRTDVRGFGAQVARETAGREKIRSLIAGI